MTFIKPIGRATNKEKQLGMHQWQISSRLTALLSKSSRSIGASCNTFALEDSIESIADGHTWSYHVLSYQGAPSVDFSALRPKDSLLGSGGKSSGAVSFVQPFDAIVSTMRREEKKNGAGIAYLDWEHPDLDEFLALPTKAAYKAVYIPMHNTPEADEFLANSAIVDKLAKAYDEFKCFLVKRPLPYKSTPLYTNLCTEVEIPHKGFCILGAVNLSQFTLDTLHQLPDVFTEAAFSMLHYTRLAQAAASFTPLNCENTDANFQFGLGVYGLASLLASSGVTYKVLADELHWLFNSASDSPSINALVGVYDSFDTTLDPVGLIVYWVAKAYEAATKALQGTGIRAAFCIQPTVSTAQRSFDVFGYHASPEIQPVIGLKHPDAVSTILKSAIKGDKQLDYHPACETIDQVSYTSYAEVSGYWQRIMDSTGLAHRHSHCFFGREFTPAHLRQLYVHDSIKHIKSMYYRLPSQVNPEALDKSQLWTEYSPADMVDFDVDALLSGGQTPGGIECECQM